MIKLNGSNLGKNGYKKNLLYAQQHKRDEEEYISVVPLFIDIYNMPTHSHHPIMCFSVTGEFRSSLIAAAFSRLLREEL